MANLSEAVMRRDVSWHNMYFTQPPVSFVVVEEDTQSGQSSGEWR